MPIESVAFDSYKLAAETAKVMITASTGIIGLSVTFSKDSIASSKSRWAPRLMAASWVAYLLAIISGVALLENIAGHMHEDYLAQSVPKAIYGPSILLVGKVHVLSFLLGTLLVVLSGGLALRAGAEKLPLTWPLLFNCYLEGFAARQPSAVPTNIPKMDAPDRAAIGLALALGTLDRRLGRTPLSEEAFRGEIQKHLALNDMDGALTRYP